MQRNFKILFVVLCLGLSCLMILNKTINRHNNFIHQKKLEVELKNHIIENENRGKTMISYTLSVNTHSKINDEMKYRRKRINYLCATLESSDSTSMKKVILKLIMDIKHNITWCPIYKSASSMWMKKFAVLSGFSTTESLGFMLGEHIDYSNIVKQKFQSNNNIKKKFNQMSKTSTFLIVRHPFERLLSAYRDKLEHMQDREYYYKRYGQYITHRYRAKNSNLTSLEPSFTEFLQFIAKEKRFDEHWIPFFDSCLPCSINYEYIFKFESLSSEYNFFINEKKLQYCLNYSKDVEHINSQRIKNDLISKKYFQDVPEKLLLDIFKIYELDFLLFSYNPAKYYYMTKDANNKEIHNFLT